jgi:hypothetical protein
MRTVLAVALIVLVLCCPSVMGAGGLEIEVGDVPGNEIGSNLNKGKQDEMEKSRLKSLDEKIRRAEEEGNQPTVEKREADLTPQPSKPDQGGGKP